jgi:membrane protease YdiL (CAAX protease family)
MDGPGIALFFVGGLGPFIGALVVTGQTGFPDFRARLVRMRVPYSRYLGAILLPIPMALGFLVVLAGLQGAQLSFGSLAPIGAYPGLLFGGMLFGGLEEPGWRGFAQAYLQERFTWLTASLMIGVVWAVWHVPLFLIPSTVQARLPFSSFALMGIGLSILFAWAFNWATLSVPVLILLHGGFNAAQGWSGILDSGTTSTALLAMLVVVWSMAIFAVIASRPSKIVSRRRTVPETLD